MATSQATMEAMRREARANAKEDMVTLASEARQKVDRAMASAQGLGGKIVHPFDAGARQSAQSKATSLKRQSSEKQANIREMARQMAEEERLAARSQVAQQVLGGAGGMRYPVPVYPPSDAPPPPASHQAGEQEQEHRPHDAPVEHPPIVDNAAPHPEVPSDAPVEHPPIVDNAAPHSEVPSDAPVEHPPIVDNAAPHPEVPSDAAPQSSTSTAQHPPPVEQPDSTNTH